MKSAYEIALERMEAESGPTRKLSDEDKTRLAEIDQKYDAHIAELKLNTENKLATAPPPERPGIQEELRAELGRIEERREKAKEEVWKAPGA